MNFYFVNVPGGTSLPRSEERRNVRAHVQRGRGGRKRRAAPRQVALLASTKQAPELLRCPFCLQGGGCHRAHFMVSLLPSLNIRQPIWDDLALVKFPFELTQSHRHALHECHRVIRKLMYPPAFCTDTDGLVTTWMHFVLEDEAYLQSALAYTASFADWFAGEPNLSPRALGHLAKAYALISERLSGPYATSRSTIATVTSISLYQRLHRLQSLGRLHFEGLLKILTLRGGMVTLAADDRALALKPWGLDLEFALQDGQAVRFVGEHGPTACLELSKLSADVPLRFTHLRSTLVGTFLDLQHFTNLLNAVGEHNKVDPLDYSQHAQHLLYRLLWFCPLLDSSQLLPGESILHMTLIAFCITLLPEHGGQHKRFELLAKDIRTALEDDTGPVTDDPDLRLWILFVAGISVTDSSDNEWLLPLLATTLQELRLSIWTEVTRVLKSIMWLGALQDVSGSKLFGFAQDGQRII